MTSYQHYLHQQALKIAEQFRKTEGELLEILQKVEKQRVYSELGYTSLFKYATQALKFSDAVAYEFIQVARKAKEVPELKTAIQQGEITVSKAQRVVSVITPTNKSELLLLAKTLPKRELEKEVARLNPRVATLERSRYVSESRLELRLGVSESLMQQLKRAQDLLSSQQRRAVTLEETLSSMVTEHLDRHDPLVKAQRARQKEHQASLTKQHRPTEARCPGRVPEIKVEVITERQAFLTSKELEMPAAAKGEGISSGVPERKAIVAAVKHQVMLHDQGQCTYQDAQGRRCQEQRWLHLHHRQPKSLGGGDSAENLTLLCAGHHRIVHQSG